MLPIIIGAGVAFYLWNEKQKKDAIASAPVPDPNPNLLTQPSQRYPVQAAPSVRADNSNQPWFGGSTAFQKLSPSNYGPSQDLLNAGAILDIGNQAAELWANLDIGSWWGSGGDDSSVGDYAMNDYDSFDLDWSEADWSDSQQSVWAGDEYAYA